MKAAAPYLWRYKGRNKTRPFQKREASGSKKSNLSLSVDAQKRYHPKVSLRQQKKPERVAHTKSVLSRAFALAMIPANPMQDVMIAKVAMLARLVKVPAFFG